MPVAPEPGSAAQTTQLRTLSAMNQSRRVNRQWVPTLCGVDGNELADVEVKGVNLRKMASDLTYVRSEPLTWPGGQPGHQAGSDWPRGCDRTGLGSAPRRKPDTGSKGMCTSCVPATAAGRSSADTGTAVVPRPPVRAVISKRALQRSVLSLKKE